MITDLKLRNAKSKAKDYSLNVDTGLSILVKATGSKLWRFRYSFLGKRCMISLGKYPQVSIKDAKAKQREYFDMLDKGINLGCRNKPHKNIIPIKFNDINKSQNGIISNKPTIKPLIPPSFTNNQ